jgi:hypothetical protein
VRRLLIGEDIPTAIDYAAMVALIVGACILAGRGLGAIPG